MKTVADLIAELQKFPPDAFVVVDGYEAGFDDWTVKKSFAVRDLTRPTYNGDYEQVPENRAGGVPVVVVSRDAE